MLLQVVALLSLGVLGSSAPLQTAGPSHPRRGSLQEESPRTSARLIIGELLHDVKDLNSSAVSSVVMVNAAVERCMSSHLKTFVSTLNTLNLYSKFLATKLSSLGAYEDILPKDLDKNCKTAQTAWKDFKDTLITFLRLLSEKIQDA